MTSFKMLGVLLLIVLWFLPLPVHGQSRSSAAKVSSGSICIAKVEPPNSGEKSLANPAGGNRVSSYSVQVDKRKPTKISNDKSINLSGLAVDQKHLVKIFGDGKLETSFRFAFSEYSTRKLCLFFKSLYETWQLWDAKDGGSVCACSR